MTGYSPRRRGSILSDMADIAQDLWASVPETVPAEKPTAVRDEPTAPHAPQTAQNPAKSADSAPKATYADEKSLPFTELWKVADEPIDWTEVVSSPIPTDGLVSAEKWALYRQYADKVLSGDTAAYLGVLKAVDPMRDLAPYTSSLSVATRDADVMLATFAVRDDLLDSDGEHYLCGLSLRIARDLFATLPVTHVIVTATQKEQNIRRVDFPRSAMQNARFQFVDPVAFVGQLGKNALWDYVRSQSAPLLTLSFDEIQQIAGIPIDHSFLQYKKELTAYGCKSRKSP